MQRWVSAMLAVLFLFCLPATAEVDWDIDSEFAGFDDGYDGVWTQVNALGFEFCLPEGWSATTVPEGAAFAAAKDDGDASLAIRLAAENVNDLAAWGASNLKNAQPGAAGFYDVLLTGGNKALSAYLIISDDQVIAFDFTRANDEALTLDFALRIVGSACVLWDDDVPLMEGDEGFDFGEAFEADLG